VPAHLRNCRRARCSKRFKAFSVSKSNSTPAWLEVTVTASEEVSEAVADTLARYATGGVALGYQSIDPDPDGEGRPRGPMEVRAYLPFKEGLETKRSQLAEALWHLSQIVAIPEPVYRPIPNEDWSKEWKNRYRPIRVGRRIHIIPSWYKAQAERSMINLRLDPGMAFGTGTHPTTQLCLEALEDHVRKNDFVMDLGCGSGILAIAAAKLGAGQVLGVDLDADAVRIARENARRNRVIKKIVFEEGSLDLMLAQGRKAPIVAANILAIVILKMMQQGLPGLLAPGGRMILSGILLDQSKKIEDALQEHRCIVEEKRIREDWVALVAKAEE
jgi:ribosomal protein L11 methyltransferase